MNSSNPTVPRRVDPSKNWTLKPLLPLVGVMPLMLTRSNPKHMTGLAKSKISEPAAALSGLSILPSPLASVSLAAMIRSLLRLLPARLPRSKGAIRLESAPLVDPELYSVATLGPPAALRALMVMPYTLTYSVSIF